MFAKRMEHINLRVPSIKKTQAFLAAAFEDFRQRGNGYSETYGYWSHFGNDETYIALLQSAKPGEEDAQPVPDYHYDDQFRLMHIGMEVEDIKALMERLRRQGLEPDLTDDTHPHRRRVYYLDGNNVEWEFIQYLSDKPAERNDYSL